ncbi:Carbon catabolite repressor protein 4 5, variant 3 [Stylosanthes scabra]|uniref:Carbon catabolite repressor protein 4 5, variant 3 n=1 Tax=Stylosanthes scabra TaxID=79078 RepID=A0ABU6SEZ7_9FABA|nr:Carbon catabolite repressor protein 4 5, variant 3 [Stylosanthes scabra]
MATRNNRLPPLENPNTDYRSKRRRPHRSGPSDANFKRRRQVPKSENFTGTHEPHRLNRFQAISSSSQNRRKKRRIGKSGGISSRGACSRRWAFSSADCSNCNDKITIVSYNILGVENASNHLDLYANTRRSFLEWERRKRLIFEEINTYNASVLCFQEVDHFNDLDNLFQNNGFKGVYKARTGEAHDGCALFWKDKLFTLLHQEDIEFQRFGLRNNVAQLCVLEARDDKPEPETSAPTTVTSSTQRKRFVIGNIHVLFNPNRGDIKLGQVRLLLDKAYKLSEEWGSIPVIIAGDLNSLPQSAIYEFLASSKLDIQLHNRKNMSGQLEIQSTNRVFRSQIGYEASISMSRSRQSLYGWTMEELNLATGAIGVTNIQHNLNLRSAYSGVPGNHNTRDDIGEPLATSYHSKFMGTVDYIWYLYFFILNTKIICVYQKFSTDAIGK